MMYINWFFRLVVWFIAVLFGPIGYFVARYTGFLKSIYGNRVDGWGGDASYKKNEAKKWYRKPWPDFWWSVIRNPANNLARKNVASGKVQSIKHGKIFHTAVIDRDDVWFFFTPKWPVMFKIGYKIWPSVRAGDIVTAKLAFSIQKGNK